VNYEKRNFVKMYNTATSCKAIDEVMTIKLRKEAEAEAERDESKNDVTVAEHKPDYKGQTEATVLGLHAAHLVGGQPRRKQIKNTSTTQIKEGGNKKVKKTMEIIAMVSKI
jgi:hypothetical protein